MKRRRLVAALPATLAAATAGCLDSTATTEPASDSRSNGTTAATATDTSETTDRVASASKRSDALADVTLRIDGDVLTPAAPAATATVENGGDEPVQANLAAWKVTHDGDVVVPERWAEPMHTLDAGESHAYPVRLGGDPTTTGYSDSTVRLGDVETGEYAFRLQVGSGEPNRTLEAHFRVERDAST